MLRQIEKIGIVSLNQLDADWTAHPNKDKLPPKLIRSHSAAVAALVQEKLGGVIQRIDLTNSPWREVGRHHRNLLPTGLRVDLSCVLTHDYPKESYPTEEISPQSLLADGDTQKRFQLLRSRLG